MNSSVLEMSCAYLVHLKQDLRKQVFGARLGIGAAFSGHLVVILFLRCNGNLNPIKTDLYLKYWLFYSLNV